MERRLAAILAADVVGYSRLMGEDEAGTLERLKSLRRELVQPKIIERKGRIVKLMGDGLLAEFPSIVEAVLCAVDIQQDMTEREPDISDERRILLRIGVNLGDIIVEGSDIYGDGVNVAARLEALADPGGVCISGPAFDTVHGKLDAAFEDMGERQMKNIAKPVRVYRLSSTGPQDGLPTYPAETLPLPDKPSIAVLPFSNMSGDPEQEYFSDGITEDIITELSRFSSLFVIARNSSFAYKGQSVDLRQVAQELGVRYVLEGSIRRAGKRVRITAQLIDSETGNHVWAERYDRDLEDIFDLQDEITRNVVGSIAPQIELAEVERSRKLSGAGLTAYELALKAQALFYDGVRAADPNILERAKAQTDAALELDPRNTHALWTKGFIFLYEHVYRWDEDPGAKLASAMEIADRLIHIDPSNAKSYIVRALAHQYHREFDAAIDDHRRAVTLNPNLALNYFMMSWSEAVAGLASEAREHAQTALRLSPRDTDIWLGEGYGALALASFIEGDLVEAMKWARLAIQMHGNMPVRQALMIACNAYLGDLQAAEHYAESLAASVPGFIPGVLSGDIEVCKMPEHNALLVDGLRKAGLSA